MSNTFSVPRGSGHDDFLNSFDHQSKSYQSSELFRSDSSAPLAYTFKDDENAKFVGCANLEHVDILTDLPNHLSTLDPSKTFQPDAIAPTLYVSNDAAASVITQSDIPRLWATEHDWTRHRTLITELYGENKLPKVMSIMESQQGFKATVKMYKTHIAKWGLDKKNKEPEMRAIVRKNKQRAERGKRSNFRVRNRHLDLAEVIRYWERKGVTIDEVIARSTASPTPEAVECFTPISSPITPPEDLATPEYMLRIIRGYIAGSFESGTWVKTDPRINCYSIKDRGRTSYLTNYGNLCQLAAGFFSMGNFDEVERALSAASAISGKMLIAERPETLVRILHLAAKTQGSHNHEIALRILRQLSALSKELLGESHPLCLFGTWLASMQWPRFKGIISRCSDVMVDDFESLLGTMHASTLRCCFLSSNKNIYEGSSSVPMVQKLVDKCETKLGSHDPRTLDVRVWLMILTSNEGRFIEAKSLAEQLLASIQGHQATAFSETVPARALAILAQGQYVLGEPHLAIANLQAAIHLRMMESGSQDGGVMIWLSTLEQWFIAQGHLNTAMAVRDQRIEGLDSTEIA